MAQDEISKKVELNWLSAFYGGLLTDKQRQVLTLHCEEDLSLTEIAQEVGISRQGVHELLTRAREDVRDGGKAPCCRPVSARGERAGKMPDNDARGPLRRRGTHD